MRIQIFSKFAAVVTAVVGLAACSAPTASEGTDRYAFVASSRANCVSPTVTPAISEFVDAAVEDRASVMVVGADGDPKVVNTLQIANTANNPSTAKKQDTANAAAINDLLSSSTAVTAEANTLKSIGLAAAWLADGDGKRSLVVIDCGLQTVAPLRFEDGLLQPGTDPQQVLAVVQQQGSVPPLSGIDVTWFALGQTVEPQPALSLPAIDQLKSIWSAVLLDGTPSSLTFANEQLPAQAVDGLPPVTIVPVPEMASATGSAVPVSVPLSWKDVTFVGDSAEFANPDAAKAAVTDLAQQLISGGYVNIHITGTTANVGPVEGQVALSTERALAVRDLLIGLGVSASAFTEVTGVGSDFPGHVPEYAADGAFSDELAQQNRLVIVSATN